MLPGPGRALTAGRPADRGGVAERPSETDSFNDNNDIMIIMIILILLTLLILILLHINK